MSGRFVFGAVAGVLLWATPPITLVMYALGAGVLVTRGLRGGDTVTEGVLWASAWVALLTLAILALLAVGLGMWAAPFTTFGVLALFALGFLVARYERGDKNGTTRTP